MEQPEIKDPQIQPHESAIVVSAVDGEVTAAIFHGSEIKQNSISYQIVEQLLSAIIGSSKDATLLEDTTGVIPAGSDKVQEG